jgi:outer membrane beta-barrel protein
MTLALAFVTLTGLGAPQHAAAADAPGLEALDSFRETKRQRSAIENRFFLKESRFEVAPQLGYVPNNPFAKRYVGGVSLSYHFSEQLSLQSQITYSPDLGEGDLKGLTSVLLDRAYNASSSSSSSFQQPLDKVVISAVFGAAWAPIYGKINLVGETVLNFDLYGVVGVGMVSKANAVARYDNQQNNPDATDIVALESQGNEVRFSPMVAVGQNYFLSQSLALKLDARSLFYVDNKPQYDPSVPVSEQRLYNNFIVSAGLAVYFPRMKPRLYNF